MQTTIREASTEVFDRQLKRRQRQLSYNRPDSDYYDYLRVEAGDRLLDRLDDITRSFPLALEVGSYNGHILKGVQARSNPRGAGGLGGIQQLIQCDIIDRHEKSASSLFLSSSGDSNSSVEQSAKTSNEVIAHSVVCDEEFLPFKEETFDLVLSSLTLHWTNDIPSALSQIKNVLKPDGAFIGNMFAGGTLRELRHCFYLAEQERKGGFSPHGSPLAKASDVAYLMQSAGFSMPTIDVDEVTVWHTVYCVVFDVYSVLFIVRVIYLCTEHLSRLCLTSLQLLPPSPSPLR